MLKYPMTYTDFNGNQRNDVFFFNLNEPELMKMRRAPIAQMLKNIQYLAQQGEDLSDDERDTIYDQIVSVFEGLIISAYGEKGEDGYSFVKKDPDGHSLGQQFVATAAYSKLFMNLVSNPDAANAFLRGIMPADVVAEIDRENVTAIPRAN